MSNPQTTCEHDNVPTENAAYKTCKHCGEPEYTQAQKQLLHDGTRCPHGLWVEFKDNDTCLICGYQTFQNRRLPHVRN